MDIRLFDTHTHFNFSAFREDGNEIMQKTLQEKIWFVNVGAEAKTSRRAVEIAQKFEKGVYASVGLHPIHTYDDELEEEIKGEKVQFVTKAEEFDKQYYQQLIKENPKVVAVGETGLDYFHIKKFSASLQKDLKKKQKEIFVHQIKLAFENGKPLILHCRQFKEQDAYFDMLAILKENKKHLLSLPGIVHCYSGNLELLAEFLNLGFFLGFNGIITFTQDYDELVKKAPLSRIVLETDSPWLAPVPYRGKRNQSIYVEEVAKRVSELKNLSFEEVSKATTENAMKVFSIQN